MANERVSWDQRWRGDGGDRFRVGRAGPLLVAEWPGLARFECRQDGARARLVVEPGTNPEHVEKLRRGAVNGLLGDIRGDLGLHASAVAIGGRGLVVVGQHGAGKSTAAGELCLHHGARLLADDVTLIEVRDGTVRVRPTERHHSLTPHAMRLLGLGRGRAQSTKVAVRPAAAAMRRPCPVSLVAVLRSDGRRRRPAVRDLGGASAARALLTSILRFDFRAERRRELDHVLAVYESCRVVEVLRPARADRASLIGKLLLSLLEEALGHG
jgi:hypothetical protein